MPPLAIIAASAAVGAGANIASSMSSAGAAKSAANTNAAAIAANSANNTGLISDLERGNEQAYGQARDAATSAVQLGTQQAADGWTGAHQANADALNTAYGHNLDAANTLGQQGNDLYGNTITRGNQAGNAINSLLGLGGDSQEAAFKNWLGSTGFNFALKTGSDAIASNAATKGLLSSGGTAKALDSFGQQTGQNYFGNYLASLQGQQSTGLTAANALSGVYGNVAGLNTNANNGLAGGLNTNNTNTANALSGIYTGQGSALAEIDQNYASGLRSLQSSATGNLVAANSAATGAQVGNTNNALSQTVSSNNAMANGISGLAGNVAGAYGLSQGLSSYASPNALAQTGSATSILGGPVVASPNGSSYALNNTLPKLSF